MAFRGSHLLAKAVCGISPKTPNHTCTVLVETGNVPIQITPLDSIETERDPETPLKDPTSKKKSGKFVSKRKLFLQNGQNLQINKAKRYNASKISNAQSQGEHGSKANYPLTERQQLQYLLEVTAKEVKQDSESSSCEDLQSNSIKIKKRNISKDNQIEARIRRRNERGETALHIAAIKGDLEDLVALIKAGAVVNATDNAGWTPLHEACNYGNLRIVQELVWSGADVNSPGYEAITPLHDAVVNDHTKVVRFLLDNGADPKMQTSQNYSTLDLARSASVRSLLSPEHTIKNYEAFGSQEYHYHPSQAKEANTVSKLYGANFSFENSMHNDDTFNNFVPVCMAEKKSSKAVGVEGSPDMETVTCIKPQLKSKDRFVNDQREASNGKEAASTLQPSRSTAEEKNDSVNHDRVAWHVQQAQVYNFNSGELQLNGNADVVESQNIAKAAYVSNIDLHNLPRGTAFVSTFLNTCEESIATEAHVQKNTGRSFALEPGHVLPVTQGTEEDTPAPEKLNECLDKAMIEISSYLESSQMLPHPDDKNQNKDGPGLTEYEQTFTGSSQTSNYLNLDASSKASTLIIAAETLQSHSNPCLGNEQLSLSALSREAYKKSNDNNVLDNSFEQQSVENFTKIKTRNERKKEAYSVERNSKSGKRKRTVTRSFESSPSSVKEECTSHISNPSWRSEVPKYRHTLSSLPLSVPGYEDFLINSKNRNRSNISSNELIQETEKESQLDRLISQHGNEKVKLRMTVEQELVRLFGNYARKKAGYHLPYGACTVLTSQMVSLGVKRAWVGEEEPVSIQSEVDKILSKFNKLKREMLRRHDREIEAVLALENFWSHTGDLTTECKFHTRTWQKDDSRPLYGEDFELLPAKFAEYYEEVLCATD